MIWLSLWGAFAASTSAAVSFCALANALRSRGLRQRFERKGHFSDCLAQIATYVITAEYPAFLGVSAILEKKLMAGT